MMTIEACRLFSCPKLQVQFTPNIVLLQIKVLNYHKPRQSRFVRSKVKLSLDKERLQKAVEEFPWKKAQTLVLQQTVSVGSKALKVSLLTLFILSFSSDVFFSFTSNCELLVPIALFLGCLLTDFFNEISQQLFPFSLDKSLSWKLAAGISCLFVFTKFISTFLPLQGHVFLLNLANGALMQLLWLWLTSSSSQGKDSQNRDNQTVTD